MGARPEGPSRAGVPAPHPVMVELRVELRAGAVMLELRAELWLKLGVELQLKVKLEEVDGGRWRKLMVKIEEVDGWKKRKLEEVDDGRWRELMMGKEEVDGLRKRSCGPQTAD